MAVSAMLAAESERLVELVAAACVRRPLQTLRRFSVAIKEIGDRAL